MVSNSTLEINLVISLSDSTKSQISRSNSAPQAQNRFSLVKGDGKTSSPKKQKHQADISPSPLATLSDGKVRVDQEQAAQAAASVLITVSQQQRGVGDGQEGNASSKRSQASAAPLCDANNSPSSTKRYYSQQGTMSFSQNIQPEEVWQQRDPDSKLSVPRGDPAANKNSTDFLSKHSYSLPNGSEEIGSSLHGDAATESNNNSSSSPMETQR